MNTVYFFPQFINSLIVSFQRFYFIPLRIPHTGNCTYQYENYDITQYDFYVQLIHLYTFQYANR